MADDSNTQQSAAQLAKLQRVEDGKRAMAEYLAERDAVRAKTARLRALRLARETELKRTAKTSANKKSGGSKARKAKSGAARSAA